MSADLPAYATAARLDAAIESARALRVRMPGAVDFTCADEAVKAVFAAELLRRDGTIRSGAASSEAAALIAAVERGLA